MAENPIEGLIGPEIGDEADNDLGAGISPIAGEAAAAALSLGARTESPKLVEETIAFLTEQKSTAKAQRRLLEIQSEHLHEQRLLVLSRLKLRRWRERLQLVLQALVGVLILALVLGVGALTVSAFRSHSVLVDSFDAPPALAARGLSGRVVATDVLDTLQKLQNATHSSTAGLNTRSAWASDVRIEVPETGVSIGEISRLLHERFGHDLHIDGDLIQTDTGGLTLTVRGDDIPASAFTGGPGDLDKLAVQAAEYVYSRSQPVQFLTYLEDVNRNVEAASTAAAAYARARSDDEREKIAHRWSLAYAGLYKIPEALEKARLALSLAAPYSSEWWAMRGDIVADLTAANGEEAAWLPAQAFFAAMKTAPKGHGPETRLLANAAIASWDPPLTLSSSLADAKLNGGVGALNTIEGPSIADDYAILHDPESAAKAMAGSDPDDPLTKAEALLLAGYTALDRGDLAAATPPLEAFYKAWLADPNLQYTYNDQPCFLGYAYGVTGRIRAAEPIFRRVGLYSRCYGLWGAALAQSGDAVGAAKVWAEGQRRLPDLPNVYLYRGIYETRSGALQAAQADLAKANATAPHFADPLKAWGDLLAKQGRWKEAVSKYDEALKYAPNWAQLHQARDAAAQRR